MRVSHFLPTAAFFSLLSTHTFALPTSTNTTDNAITAITKGNLTHDDDPHSLQNLVSTRLASLSPRFPHLQLFYVKAISIPGPSISARAFQRIDIAFYDPDIDSVVATSNAESRDPTIFSAPSLQPHVPAPQYRLPYSWDALRISLPLALLALQEAGFRGPWPYVEILRLPHDDAVATQRQRGRPYYVFSGTRLGEVGVYVGGWDGRVRREVSGIEDGGGGVEMEGVETS